MSSERQWPTKFTAARLVRQGPAQERCAELDREMQLGRILAARRGARLVKGLPRASEKIALVHRYANCSLHHRAISEHWKAVRSVLSGMARCAMAHIMCRRQRVRRTLECAASADSYASACPDAGAGTTVWMTFQANALAGDDVGCVAAAQYPQQLEVLRSSSDGSARSAVFFIGHRRRAKS